MILLTLYSYRAADYDMINKRGHVIIYSFSCMLLPFTKA